ncbi:hypothetical protein [Bradyrhizobium zhanjiangense]|nr:hypothetical protein [Bradyrhizobium zhanjiangense]
MSLSPKRERRTLTWVVVESGGIDHDPGMTDALFARAQLALEENGEIRKQRHLLRTQFDDTREKLRLSIYESASVRSEIKARQDNEGRGSPRRTT